MKQPLHGGTVDGWTAQSIHHPLQPIIGLLWCNAIAFDEFHGMEYSMECFDGHKLRTLGSHQHHSQQKKHVPRKVAHRAGQTGGRKRGDKICSRPELPRSTSSLPVLASAFPLPTHNLAAPKRPLGSLLRTVCSCLFVAMDQKHMTLTWLQSYCKALHWWKTARSIGLGP